MKSSLLRLGHIYIISDGHERFEAQYQCPETDSLQVSEHLFRRLDNAALIKVHQENIVTEITNPHGTIDNQT
jgi:hypothetical protein